VLFLGGVPERHSRGGARALTLFHVGWKPSPRRAPRKRSGFVWLVSGEAVLARGSVTVLSAPRVLAAGEGGTGGWVDPGSFGAGWGGLAAASLFAGGMVVVLRDA